MRPEHQEWIRHYVEKHDGKLLGRCHSACAEMRKAFPELVEVRGHVYDGVWGKRGHVWLRAPEGIVDPTARQFPRLLAYQAWRPGDEVLVGKCHECGKEIWVAMRSLNDPVPRREFCNAICSGYFARSLQS